MRCSVSLALRLHLQQLVLVHRRLRLRLRCHDLRSVNQDILRELNAASLIDKECQSVAHLHIRFPCFPLNKRARSASLKLHLDNPDNQGVQAIALGCERCEMLLPGDLSLSSASTASTDAPFLLVSTRIAGSEGREASVRRSHTWLSRVNSNARWCMRKRMKHGMCVIAVTACISMTFLYSSWWLRMPGASMTCH